MYACGTCIRAGRSRHTSRIERADDYDLIGCHVARENSPKNNRKKMAKKEDKSRNSHLISGGEGTRTVMRSPNVPNSRTKYKRSNTFFCHIYCAHLCTRVATIVTSSCTVRGSLGTLQIFHAIHLVLGIVRNRLLDQYFLTGFLGRFVSNY